MRKVAWNELLGFVVLLEFSIWFTLGVNVECHTIGVLNCEAAITPRMVFERHYRLETCGHQQVVLGINIGDREVVSQSSGVAYWLSWLGEP